MKILPFNPSRLSASQARGEQMALKLFQEAARRVPAYRDFLASHGVKPSAVKTIEDFQALVPPVDKKNYLTKYSLDELSWDGDRFGSRVISVSSGSTGTPFFWPRGFAQDLEGGWMHERLYRQVFGLDEGTALVVICFSMGTWIAGSFTMASTLMAIDHGLKLNVVTPGLEKEEALKVIKALGHQYDTVVLAGYPPFVKDIIDEGYSYGIKWRKLNMKFLFAGEAFSEQWRDYVLRRGGASRPEFDSVNVYGSADAAMLGHETPVSVTLRRLLSRRPALSRRLFGAEVMPSLVQYYPDRRFFEAVDGELIFTARAGIPLVRYNIHDAGGRLSVSDLPEDVQAAFAKQLEKIPGPAADWSDLPFVYLHGRKDFTVTIYAVNIYPENIKAALIDPKLRSWTTGKFTMATRYQADMDQYFEINVELARGIKPGKEYQDIAERTITSTLSKLNAEFAKLRAAIGTKAEPRVHLIEHGNAEFFGKGVKHRWVKK